MRQRYIAILAVALACVVYLEWVVVPYPIPPTMAAAVDEPWDVHQQGKYDVLPALVTLNQAGLWGKVAEAPAPPPADSQWWFVGAMARGQERHVLIRVGSQPVLTLKPGDQLPDGSKILQIENGRICVLVNNNKRYLSIY